MRRASVADGSRLSCAEVRSLPAPALTSRAPAPSPLPSPAACLRARVSFYPLPSGPLGPSQHVDPGMWILTMPRIVHSCSSRLLARGLVQEILLHSAVVLLHLGVVSPPARFCLRPCHSPSWCPDAPRHLWWSLRGNLLTPRAFLSSSAAGG